LWNPSLGSIPLQSNLARIKDKVEKKKKKKKKEKEEDCQGRGRKVAATFMRVPDSTSIVCSGYRKPPVSYILPVSSKKHLSLFYFITKY
jgi:hypothetical protein